jgi:hypothetical protein
MMTDSAVAQGELTQELPGSASQVRARLRLPRPEVDRIWYLLESNVLLPSGSPGAEAHNQDVSKWIGQLKSHYWASESELPQEIEQLLLGCLLYTRGELRTAIAAALAAKDAEIARLTQGKQEVEELRKDRDFWKNIVQGNG